ncbi:GNAT family N-acetyltransferase [Marinomonas balearica]|uniref:GNAT family acetyltransferase n=1 Tax=Marinomonas balearica TaxID=491947 RepID=A0A4R6MLE9_9GAMM|nr:GNAT family N-acetyltransferase [Marinomonas balearica]TDP01831.1 GNAT family acetyltransferase [Marinomonas balearica]
MLVRNAEIQDLEQVVSLFHDYRAFNQCDNNPMEEVEFIKNRLENNDSTILLAIDNGEVVGFTQLYPLFSSTAMKKLFLLNDLYVLPESRGKGAANSLIEKAKQMAIKENARGLFLETQASNKTAQSLYEKVGFVKNDNFFYCMDL